MHHVDRVVNLIESHGQYADVRMLTSIQDGPESIAAITDVLARVGAEPVLRTITAGTSDGVYMVGVCIQRMDLCVPVSDLPNSGIVGEVKAFKDAEVRRLTREYSA